MLICESCKTEFHEHCLKVFTDTTKKDFCPLCYDFPVQNLKTKRMSLYEFKNLVRLIKPKFFYSFFGEFKTIESQIVYLLHDLYRMVVWGERNTSSMYTLLATLIGCPFFSQEAIQTLKGIIADRRDGVSRMEEPTGYYKVENLELYPRNVNCMECGTYHKVSPNDVVAMHRFNGVVFFCQKCFTDIYVLEVKEEPSPARIMKSLNHPVWE